MYNRATLRQETHTWIKQAYSIITTTCIGVRIYTKSIKCDKGILKHFDICVIIYIVVRGS